MAQSPVNVNPNDVDGVFLLDGSGSMGWGAERGNTGESRWNKGQKLMSMVASELAAVDDDGICVYLFNNRLVVEDGVTPDKVAHFFRTHRPDGGTLLAPAITDLVNRYLPAKKKTGFMARGYEKVTPPKPVFVLVFGDGQPSDKDKVAAAIVDATQRTDRGNIGFMFVQVGYDDEAAKFLEWLDENLRGAAYDCVAITRLEQIAGQTTEELIVRAFNGG